MRDDTAASMCTCPIDAFNDTSMAETDPLPPWLLSERTESFASFTPVDRWPISQSQRECWWTSRSGSVKLIWLLDEGGGEGGQVERPAKIEKPDSVIVAARPLVAAMLTMIFAYFMIRNLMGWHRSLPTDGRHGRMATSGGLRLYRRRWRDDGDWIDYFADDSDSFDAMVVENDYDRLFIGPVSLPARKAALCAVTYQEELEEEGGDNVSMQLYDATSLSSDGWSSSCSGESLAVTGQEPPLHHTLLICSPLTACYIGRPDGSNASDGEENEFEFQSISSGPSFATAPSSMSFSFEDAVSDCSVEFDTASSG